MGMFDKEVEAARQQMQIADNRMKDAEGEWPRFHAAHSQVEGAPGPSPLGTGEGESSCLLRIHAGSCQPLSQAVQSDSISTVPCMPRLIMAIARPCAGKKAQRFVHRIPTGRKAYWGAFHGLRFASPVATFTSSLRDGPRTGPEKQPQDVGRSCPP